MKMLKNNWLCLTVLLAALAAPAFATVKITALTSSANSPQALGTQVTFQVTASDSNPGPLAFQYNVAVPLQPLALVWDFNPGTYGGSGSWTSSFTWVPTGVEGTYQIQVVVKDFASGESSQKTFQYQITPLVTGSTPVVAATANPLVALFSSPACAAGSSMRVYFRDVAKKTPAAATNFQTCHPPATMNFEVAGMYPNTTYGMFAQTKTGSKITNGPPVTFTTGPLPSSLPFPTYKVLQKPTSQTDTKDRLILTNPIPFGAQATYPEVATDLTGRIVWYYAPNPLQAIVLTRPLAGGNILTIQNGISWYPTQPKYQFIRLIDLAGNTIKETNLGALQQELHAMGAVDANLCTSLPSPAPVGSSCMSSFHHEVIQLPTGDTALFVAIEKIFPPGTQGSTSPDPVDIIGNYIVVLDSNWQVKWYFDTFEHDGGAPQLDINRAAVLGETCTANEQGCPPVFLLGTGIAPAAFDWIHANTIYYQPQDHNIIWSSRDQDWVMKIDYNDGAGTGNILWRMGIDGDFTMNNVFNDSYPWFTHQHDAGIENNGAGPMTVFDNGNTRIASNPGQHSRCMALTVNQAALQVTPVLSQDAGAYSPADGAVQLLANGNFYCFNPVVLVNLNTEDSYSLEYVPTAGTDTGTQVLDISGPDGWRGWRMPNMYTPPTT
jgi:arylsulfate sulfotransferase